MPGRAPTRSLYGNTSLLTTTTYPGGNDAAAAAAKASNQYQFQLERATLVSGRVPRDGDLAALTKQVALNNYYVVTPDANDATVMDFVRSKIQHVIYIIKETVLSTRSWAICATERMATRRSPSSAAHHARLSPDRHELRHARQVAPTTCWREQATTPPRTRPTACSSATSQGLQLRPLLHRFRVGLASASRSGSTSVPLFWTNPGRSVFFTVAVTL